ncbi:MAG: cyclodehydratase, partial [Microbacterium sp.]|nr:cyclodehydratase [Microbacterium sp.]
MIRLDQAAPPLFRSDGTVQFGAPARARVEYSAPWVERAIDALEAGTTRSELRALARLHRAPNADADADALLTTLSPALVRSRRPGTFVVQTADDLPPAAVRAVLAALPARSRLVAWAGADTAPVAAGSRVVLLAAHRVDPRRASALLREGVVHLPLVLDGASATIGPVVHPGRTACLSCLD